MAASIDSKIECKNAYLVKKYLGKGGECFFKLKGRDWIVKFESLIS